MSHICSTTVPISFLTRIYVLLTKIPSAFVLPKTARKKKGTMSDSLTSITSVFLLILRLTTAIFIGLSLGLVWCTFDFNGLPNRTLWDARIQDPGADGSDASWNTTRAFAIITACFSAFQVIGILFNFITCNKHPSYSAQMIFDLMIWVCACISWGVTSTNKGLISFSLLNVSVSIPSNKVCNQGES